MNRHDIFTIIKKLALSQGFYSSIYCKLVEMKENDILSYNKVMETLEKQNFKDSLDLVLYFET